MPSIGDEGTGSVSPDDEALHLVEIEPGVEERQIPAPKIRLPQLAQVRAREVNDLRPLAVIEHHHPLLAGLGRSTGRNHDQAAQGRGDQAAVKPPPAGDFLRHGEILSAAGQPGSAPI
ncbi:MAG: hypothetical protein ACYTGE_09210 [Planctomycetota bacterium]